MKRPDPTRIVADVDVLLCDLFIDGEARSAMDRIRAHSWIELFASDHLIDRTVTAIEHLGDESLADAWRARFIRSCSLVEHPPEDTPALASAYAAGAGHLLSMDPRLRSPETGLAMRSAMPISIRDPRAFLRVYDPASLHEAVIGGPYPGADRDPRS